MSARNACANALHHLFHLGKRRHSSVAGGGHSQSSMGGTAFHRPLCFATRQKSVDQTRGKRISAADAVEYLQILACNGAIEGSAAITNCSPIIDRRTFYVTQ